MDTYTENTHQGVFDMNLSLDQPNIIKRPATELSDNFQPIEIYQYEADAQNKLPALSEEDSWHFYKNAIDVRTKATVDFAEEWARRMQKELSEGKELKEIWDKCANDSDSEFITSDMKYWAARILMRHWAHRDKLQEVFNDYWHNEGALRQQVQNEILEDLMR